MKIITRHAILSDRISKKSDADWGGSMALWGFANSVKYLGDITFGRSYHMSPFQWTWPNNRHT